MMAVEDLKKLLPDMARPVPEVLVEALCALDERTRLLDNEIARRAKEDEVARRLMTIPGIGPVIAMALTALARRLRRSNVDGILPRGLGSHRCNTPLGANSGSVRPRRWGNERCAVCSSSGRVLLSGGRREREPWQDHGWRVCSNANRRCL